MQYARTAAVERDVDEGLRSYMLAVYNFMGAGLALSGLAAMLVAWTSLGDLFLSVSEEGIGFTGLGWLVVLMPLAMLLIAMFRDPGSWSASGTQAFYWVFTAAQGVGLSVYLMTYTSGSIVRAFFITASAFAALSLYGYLTKRDLTGLGAFCFMGLVGMVLTALAAMLFGGDLPVTLFSAVGVLVMAGLTAYDTQKIKQRYRTIRSEDEAIRVAVWSALDLYLDALLLFKYILNLTGSRD